MMMFHTIFVLQTIFGWQIRWNTQNRTDAGLSVLHCLKLYGWLSVLGVVMQQVSFFYLGHSALWLLPIFLGWILAPVLAWVTSSGNIGQALRRARLFITPEEIQPPPELAGLNEAESAAPTPSGPLWTHALLCPYIQAIHLSMVRQRTSDEATHTHHGKLRERLIEEGPHALAPREKLHLLSDADAVFWLHQELWSRAGDKLHPSWLRLQAECGDSPLVRRYIL
jgi:membrane glycosyltransferase